MNISELIGKTIIDIIDGEDFIIFQTSVDEVIGDFKNLMNLPIIMAKEEVTHQNPPGAHPRLPHESFTWTIYRLATIKGYVTIRWYGHSNGEYNERVIFEKILED